MAQVMNGQQARHCGGEISDDHPGQNTEQLQPALVPDVEPSHDGQRAGGNKALTRGKRAGWAVFEQHTQCGEPDNRSHEENDKTRGFRWNEGTQARPGARQHHLHDAGENCHAPYQRQPTGLHRKQGRREINPGKDRRRQQAAADRSSRECLKQHGNCEDQKAQLQNVGDLTGWQSSLARDDQRIHHEY